MICLFYGISTPKGHLMQTKFLKLVIWFFFYYIFDIFFCRSVFFFFFGGHIFNKKILNFVVDVNFMY